MKRITVRARTIDALIAKARPYQLRGYVVEVPVTSVWYGQWYLTLRALEPGERSILGLTETQLV